jgi:hypothetical protein
VGRRRGPRNGDVPLEVGAGHPLLPPSPPMLRLSGTHANRPNLTSLPCASWRCCVKRSGCYGPSSGRRASMHAHSPRSSDTSLKHSRQVRTAVEAMRGYERIRRTPTNFGLDKQSESVVRGRCKYPRCGSWARATTTRPPSRKALRRLVLESLEEQGWTISGARPEPPLIRTKAELRALHAPSVAHRLERARGESKPYEERLLGCIASGADIDPNRIDPVIFPVHRGSHEERLFRYASLHWSIPVSSGYGRRLRFLLIDRHNDKLIGLIGLGDPVFNLGVRDRWIGWDLEARRQRLQQVMDAFVIGAVPPYSQLLMGKSSTASSASTVSSSCAYFFGSSVPRVRFNVCANSLAFASSSSRTTTGSCS